MSEVNTTPDTQQSITEAGIPEINLALSVPDTIYQGTDATLTSQGQPADAKAVGDRFDEVDGIVADLAVEVADLADAAVTKDMLAEAYPIGSVYVTTLSVVPEVLTGTWTEIMMPMTWGDLQNGTRNYETGTSTGNLHFFLRTA